MVVVAGKSLQNICISSFQATKKSDINPQA